MDKIQAKDKIISLVGKYNSLSTADKNKLNEEQTKSYFIRPFFEALGWNFEDQTEVALEEGNSERKRADYVMKISGISRMFVEAKAIKVDLDLEQHARQAINYAWNKGVNWAVLTDFESVKVFNAQAQSKLLQDKLVFEIPLSEYEQDFERIFLLSKDGFLNNALDAYAEKYGKKIKKQTVNDSLFADFKEAREILTKSFGIWNEKLDKEMLDEGVQRILDRLVFIRVLEDKGLEAPTLKPILRDWEAKGKNDQLFPLLIKKFRELDEIYNSSLFSEHACEKWEEHDDSLKKVISMLYGNNIYEYDFKEIPADILGGVYEGYLSYIAQNPINEGQKKGKLFELDDNNKIKIKSRQKRKEQGIFYTPKFIVDYIVKNTLGEKLKEAKSVNDLKKIKILDPACGSGSFLTRALEEMNNKYKDFGYAGDQYTKTEILTGNIYGVDLDAQAIELARLNLLIEALDQKAKLPNLTDNIRVGNSLISGSEEELKKYFGKDWRDKKPFNWEDEFSFCHSLEEGGSEGGFDVVIGNPPYIQSRNLNKEERHFYWDKFLTDTNHSDIYSFFIERSINLLSNKGLLGFIIPNTWLQTPSFESIRKKIAEECKILKILFFDEGVKIFSSAQVSSVVLVIQKEADKNKIKNNNVLIIKNNEEPENGIFGRIKQGDINVSSGLNIFNNKNIENILSRVFKDSESLNSVCSIIGGLRTGDDKKFLKKKKNDSDDRRLLRGRDVARYNFKWNGEYVWYKPELMKIKQAAAPKEAKFFEAPEKLLIRMITGNSIIATYDNEKFYFLQDNLILPKNKYSIKYLLAILNSKLANFIIKNKTSNIAITQALLKNFPIEKINFSDKREKFKHDELARLVNKILNLNKQLQSIPENSDKWDSVKKEIEKIDREIDKKVYELYGLNAENIKIIEDQK